MKQDLTKSLILLNGELKTLQIASISKLGANAFRVFFKNNPKYLDDVISSLASRTPE